jgi:NAD-dependent SIR2 family protein deacetylase
VQHSEFPLALSFGISHAKQLLEGKQILVLTGAGVSTDSGIPDYRGAGRVQKHPLTFDQFMGSAQNQARYWARSFVGWNRVASAEPNLAHRAIAAAEATNKVFQVITQNVDGLHQKAGSKAVLELHGRLDQVLCAGCGDILSRNELDGRIRALNPKLIQDPSVEFSPDGDAEVEVSNDFRVPACGICGHHYKPDVVFFGEQVPKDRVQRAESAIALAEALLIAGTSLTVNSGMRLVKQAKARSIPVVIVNQGETRADQISDAKLSGSAGAILKELLND